MSFDPLFRESFFGAFAQVFDALNDKMAGHPLYEPNVLREVYCMSRYDPAEHTLANAVVKESEELFEFLLVNDLYDAAGVEDAIVAAARAGRLDRMDMLFDLFLVDPRVMERLVELPAATFERAFMRVGLLTQNPQPLLELCAGLGTAANLELALELVFMTNEVMLSLAEVAIEKNNTETFWFLCMNGLELEPYHYRRVVHLGDPFMIDLVEMMNPDWVE